MIRISSSAISDFEREHLEAVRSMAPECVVLLKKDGNFPLKEPCTIAAYGSGVRHTIKGGTGSGDVNSRHFVTVEEGLKEAGFTLVSTDWLDSFDSIYGKCHEEFENNLKKQAEESGKSYFEVSFGAIMPEPEHESALDLTADCAIYVVARTSGEGHDRSVVKGDIALTDSEIRDISILSKAYRKFALVLNTGGIVDISPVEDKIGNIFILSQLGAPTGNVLSDILLGKSYPSGKLAMTWAPIENYPSTEGFADPDDTLYKEGIYVGYRYFDSFAVPKTWPFGYGLGYTDFLSRVTDFSADEEEISVSVEVENTGSFPGKEIIQLYYSAPGGKLDKPVKELAAFCKSDELEPGDRQVLKIMFSSSDMASYSVKEGAYIIEPGRYTILAGTDADQVVVAGYVDIDSEVECWKLKNIAPGCPFEDLKADPALREEAIASFTSMRPCIKGPKDPQVISLKAENFTELEIRYTDTPKESAGSAETEKAGELQFAEDQSAELQSAEKQTVEKQDPEELLNGKNGTVDDILEGRISLEEFTASLTDKELAMLCTGLHSEDTDSDDVLEVVGNASYHLAGAAGESSMHLEKRGVASIVMADGPAGLRISQQYRLEGDKAIALVSSLNLESDSGEAAGDAEAAGKAEAALENKALSSSAGHAANKEKTEDSEDAKDIYYQYCTAIPIGTALAQSWNEEVCERCGDIVGTEMEIFGVNIWLAPALNIMRNPMCGRNFEYYSEDPVISGSMAAAITDGVQKHEGCGTCIKHFCCNNQETNRYFSNSVLSERALREIYLKGFEICVTSSQPRSVMTSYNLINGEHSCSRRDLLTDVLRDEWGFEGFVMTDWLVTGGMGKSGEKHPCASAAGCVKAGNDLVMPGTKADVEEILNALNDKQHPYHLTRARLMQDAMRIIQMSMRC